MAFHVSKLPQHKIYLSKLVHVVMSLENDFNIAETQSSLYAEIRNKIHGLTGEDRSGLPTTMDVPALTPEQDVEKMAVIQNYL